MMPPLAMGDMQPKLQARVMISPMAITSMPSSTARAMPRGRIMEKVGMFPQPAAARRNVMAERSSGIHQVFLPTMRSIFLANRSMVPLFTAMLNRKAGPTSEINRLVLKLEITVLSGIPPSLAIMSAMPMARKPIFTFFQNPRTSTATRNSSDSNAKLFICIPPNLGRGRVPARRSFS